MNTEVTSHYKSVKRKCKTISVIIDGVIITKERTMKKNRMVQADLWFQECVTVQVTCRKNCLSMSFINNE